MMKIQNFDGIRKMNYNKVIITVVIVLLLICPNPSYDIRMYTTSILGRITLIIATIAVICYDPVIGIFAILLLLKLTGKPLREGAENMEDDSEKDEEKDEEKKPKKKTKKERFLDKHCVCEAMYDGHGNRNGAAWDNVCKVDKGKEDDPKTNYRSAQFWTEVPKKGFTWLAHGVGKKGKQNSDEQFEEASKKPIYPLLINSSDKVDTRITNFKMFADFIPEKIRKTVFKNMILHEGDDPIMNQFHYTDGNICNPCDKESCTNWELGQPSSLGFGDSGGGDKGGDGGDKGGGGGAVEKLIDNW